MSNFEDCMALLYERSPFRVGYWLFVPIYFLVTVAGRTEKFTIIMVTIIIRGDLCW